MSRDLMLHITPERVEFHADFVAELLATWRSELTYRRSDGWLIHRLGKYVDEGEAPNVEHAMPMLQARKPHFTEAAKIVADRFWIEYLRASSPGGGSSGSGFPNCPESPDHPPEMTHARNPDHE